MEISEDEEDGVEEELRKLEEEAVLNGMDMEGGD
jgi:hypothetical protein